MDLTFARVYLAANSGRLEVALADGRWVPLVGDRSFTFHDDIGEKWVIGGNVIADYKVVLRFSAKEGRHYRILPTSRETQKGKLHDN